MEPNQQNQNRLLSSFFIHLCSAAPLLQSNTELPARGRLSVGIPDVKYLSDRPTTKRMTIVENVLGDDHYKWMSRVRIYVARLRAPTS